MTFGNILNKDIKRGIFECEYEKLSFIYFRVLGSLFLKRPKVNCLTKWKIFNYDSKNEIIT